MKNKEIRYMSFRAAAAGTVLALALSSQAVMASQISGTTGTQTVTEQTAGEAEAGDAEQAAESSLVFAENDFYVGTNEEIEITLNVSCSVLPDEYNIVLVYDDARMEYISGADECTKEKIILRGKASEQNMTFTLKFKTLCNGNGGIYVRNAYITASDGSGEMKINEKPEAVVAIVGAETTDQPDFTVERESFGIDTEIPLVGKTTDRDGTASYIVDLSCFKPDSVDFNYTLAGDIYHGILVTTLCSEDKSVQLAYLLKEDRTLQLCAYNEGNFYPVTEEGGNYYISPYGIAQWPDGLTDKLIEKEGVIYILNSSGKGVFVKYLKGEIVNWDYKTEIEVESTEEEKGFYNFRNEDNSITVSSIWRGITSHIEISLLIILGLVLFLKWLLWFIPRLKRKGDAADYVSTLPSEVPYNEAMAEMERIAREAEFEAIRKEDEAREAAQAAIAAKAAECTILPESAEEQEVEDTTSAETNRIADVDSKSEIIADSSTAKESSVKESTPKERTPKEITANKRAASENTGSGSTAGKGTTGEKAAHKKKISKHTAGEGAGEEDIAMIKAVHKGIAAKRILSEGTSEEGIAKEKAVRKKSASKHTSGEILVKEGTVKGKAAHKSPVSRKAAGEGTVSEGIVKEAVIPKKKGVKKTAPAMNSDEMEKLVESGIKKAMGEKKTPKPKTSAAYSNGTKASSNTSQGELILDLAEIKKRKETSKRKATGKASSTKTIVKVSDYAPKGFEDLNRILDDHQTQENEDFAQELNNAFDELKAELNGDETERTDYSRKDKDSKK